jgi:hypothetical protein
MIPATFTAVLLLLLAAACGSGGSGTYGSGKTGTAAKSESHEEVADDIATSVGKQSNCYFIGSMRYRGSRTDVYQCELGATGNVQCYVRPQRKPVNVDKLLARGEVYRSLEGSDIDELACVG